jgi:arsenite methyltransferase
MLYKARKNAETGGFKNVDFVKGEIETMPFPDSSFDLVISNCVINLVPDKAQAYREIRRVLKPGGRFAIADMAIRGDMPAAVKKSAEAWAGCVAGALELEGYLATIRGVGFSDVETRFVNEYDFGRGEGFALLSVGLIGTKI